MCVFGPKHKNRNSSHDNYIFKRHYALTWKRSLQEPTKAIRTPIQIMQKVHHIEYYIL